MDSLPNIIKITPHDLGTHLGCYGWDPGIPSPHLDRLASEGVRFENHFCTAPFCSPSRGSVITGKYPHVNGLMGLVNLGWDMPDTNTFLPQIMQSAGYETLLFGTHHVINDVSRLGYDHIQGLPDGQCRTVVPEVVHHLRQMKGHRQRPFYLDVGFVEVHLPYNHLEKIPVPEDAVEPLPFLQDTPGLRKDQAMFYENIRRMDESVGQVIQCVDSLGLSENTVIVFTTDHGIAFPRAKATLYDPGIRTTLLMRWPQGLKGGQVVQELVSNVDLFATLVDIANGSVPKDCNGQSFLPLLRGDPFEARTEIFAEKNTSPMDLKRCIRTEQHKYIRNYCQGPQLALPVDIECMATRRDLGDSHLTPRPTVELYDLKRDPWEQKNLAGLEAHQAVEQEMSDRLLRILEETHDPILSGAIERPPREAEIFERLFAPEAVKQREKRAEQTYREYEEL